VELRDFSVIASPAAPEIRFDSSRLGKSVPNWRTWAQPDAIFFRRANGAAGDFPLPNRFTGENQKAFAMARWASC
jgi:hypothetical protein